MTTLTDAGRRFLLGRVDQDLIGPSSPTEVLDERPSDRYLTGILFPQQSILPPEEDEVLGVQDDAEEPAVQDPGIALGRNVRPSTMGISFALRPSEGVPPEVVVEISCGVYNPIEEPADENGRRPRPKHWSRTDRRVRVEGVRPKLQPQRRELSSHGLPGLELYVRAMRADDAWSVTVALVNCQQQDPEVHPDQRSFFQIGFSVIPAAGVELVARPSRRIANDPDSESAALIYRDAHEYAVGHTCAASWETDGDGRVVAVGSTWLPTFIVHAVSAEGAPEFKALSADASSRPLEAAWLAARTDPDDLANALGRVVTAYETWIDRQGLRIGSLPAALQKRADEHIKTCRDAATRMWASVELIRTNAAVRTAFRLAQQAMDLQRRWSTKNALRWRPFQVGFQLLTLASLARRDHPDRAVMDLLWFPTGGGKTEAYLGLIAFILFLRRINDGIGGEGVAVIMRYTLRLLTVQQFERAAALVCACELLRRGRERPDGVAADLGQVPFSIGLWVGGAATPATVAEAYEAPFDAPSNPRQLTRCPVCRNEKLAWGTPRSKTAYNVSCCNKSCPLGSIERIIPVWTVDEDVYRVRPSLLIGTVDKFAQIVRNPETGKIFGLGTTSLPPDLVIQDELHLISGPLGTLTGLYEIAIDELCSRGAVRPKVIGSTATIRRAEEQILALFNRRTSQFPPPCIDASDSGFALEDRSAPGRLYAGITTAGRSPKFSLQAVCASFLQAAGSGGITSPEQLDAYWTLVAYFNSLRELGGALVMMQDDVPATIAALTRRRGGEKPRPLEQPLELTSRVPSVRPVLDQLEVPASKPDACDVVLASNMISVGVDVPRLGLMVVNGQPKGIAEYIQSTSRVGRGAVPGLVLTVYNDSRARDRSHFESFRTWHQTLYREVEATSVTPFAARALDRAAHAVLVALARHRVRGLKTSPRIHSQSQLDEIRALAELVVSRAEDIDKDEAAAVKAHLERWIDEWWERARTLDEYWNDSGSKQSLMTSAEVHAARKAVGGVTTSARPTPNSMREVEPGALFTLRRAIRLDLQEAGDGATE